MGTFPGRNIAEVRAKYPPCGAWSRHFKRGCRQIPVKGRNRCWLHGGRAGAPKGTQSRLVHGRATAEAKAAQKLETIERRRAQRALKLATDAVDRAVKRKRKTENASS